MRIRWQTPSSTYHPHSTKRRTSETTLTVYLTMLPPHIFLRRGAFQRLLGRAAALLILLLFLFPASHATEVSNNEASSNRIQLNKTIASLIPRAVVPTSTTKKQRFNRCYMGVGADGTVTKTHHMFIGDQHYTSLQNQGNTPMPNQEVRIAPIHENKKKRVDNNQYMACIMHLHFSEESSEGEEPILIVENLKNAGLLDDKKCYKHICMEKENDAQGYDERRVDLNDPKVDLFTLITNKVESSKNILPQTDALSKILTWLKVKTIECIKVRNALNQAKKKAASSPSVPQLLHEVSNQVVSDSSSGKLPIELPIDQENVQLSTTYSRGYCIMTFLLVCSLVGNIYLYVPSHPQTTSVQGTV